MPSEATRQSAVRCGVQFQTWHTCNRDLVAHLQDAHGDTSRFTCWEHFYRVLREMRRDCAARAFTVTFLTEES